MQRAVAARKKRPAYNYSWIRPDKSPRAILFMPRVYISIQQIITKPAFSNRALISGSKHVKAPGSAANNKNAIFTPSRCKLTHAHRKKTPTRCTLLCDSLKGIYNSMRNAHWSLITIPECFNWWDFLLSAHPFSNPFKINILFYPRNFLHCDFCVMWDCQLTKTRWF